jgi:copper transport protein
MRLIAGLATLLAVLCFATVASAHASLVATEPGDGSVLAAAPKTIQLRFNETVTPAVIGLIDAEGKTRDDITVRAVDQTIVVTPPLSLPRGTEVVSYRVISQDGHPVSGSLVFSVGAPTGTTVALESAGPVGVLIWLARIGVYLGLFVGVGGVFFTSWLAPARAGSRVVIAALMLGLLSAVASLGLQGLDVLSLTLGGLATSVPWQAAFATSLGPSLLIAAVAMAAGIVAQQIASLRIARTLSRPTVFLHGVGVAFWVGALAPLVAMARLPAGGLLPTLHRFSRLAVPVVGGLVLTGLTLAIIQLQSFRALIETRYGLILSIKLALVVVLLGLAARNRFRLTPGLALHPQQTRPLVRSILLECLVVAGILAVVAGWRFTPPPRALAAAIRPPLAIHIHTEHAMFQVLVSPGKVGTDDFVLQLMNGDASPLVAKEATLVLSLPERGIEPLERGAQLGADGYWHVRDVPLPYPGRWHIRVEALVTDFEKVSLEDDLNVPAH